MREGVLNGFWKAGSMTRKRQRWSLALRQPAVWKRAACVGLPAGLLQVVIHQGDVWFNGSISTGTLAKSLVSPLVTFLVALISAAAVWIERQTPDAPCP